MEQNKENPLQGTIFDDYDTIIFDLDNTLWDCYLLDGSATYAFKTAPPYRLAMPSVVVDVNGSIIRLQQGARMLIEKLDEANKNLGIVSAGELDNKPQEAQPSILLLKKFDLYKYFNYDVIVSKLAIEDKSQYVKPSGKTLLIDDNKEYTDAVNALGKVDVLWRRAFGNWDELLVQKSARLNLGFMK